MMSSTLQSLTSPIASTDRFAGALGADVTSFDRSMHVKGGAERRSLETAAAELVSSAFVLPTLEGMNNSPLRPQTGPFAVNDAEKRFSPLLFQHFSDRVVKSAKFSLVSSIADRYAARGGDKESTDVRA
jgi:hypothetical protein